MRATDGLQTTITLGSVNHDGQVFSLGLSLEILPQLPPAFLSFPEAGPNGNPGAWLAGQNGRIANVVFPLACRTQ